MDLEMSGLDARTERILEIAVLVTNADLEVIAEGPDLVVHQPEEVLAAMDPWNTEHHTESGLVARVRASTVSEADAEAHVLTFVETHCAKGSSPLCGNSVGQDRRFIAKYMPGIDAYLHYRNIDVTTVKELARRWHPEVFEKRPHKKGLHRALEDIRESIEELRWYREKLFQ
jgi:oligoribonuclease